MLWLILGALYLNLHPIAAAIAGLVGYLCGGCAALVRSRCDPDGRWEPALRLAKWALAAGSLGLCVAAGAEPQFVMRGAVLAEAFRPSAAFPQSSFYGGWAGEPVLMAGLFLLAFAQTVLNELRFPDDRFGARALRSMPLADRKIMSRMILAVLLIILLISYYILSSTIVGGSGPRGQLFNARLGPMWACGCWGLLSALLCCFRMVRLYSSAVAIRAGQARPYRTGALGA